MRSALALALALSGCSVRPPTFDAVTSQEVAFVEEAARAARVLGVRAWGEVTDEAYAPNGIPAKGWWKAPVAYGWRPWLNAHTDDEARGVARHEVCHALHVNEADAEACADRIGGVP